MGRRRGAKWHYAAPLDGQWAQPGTVDGPIGRFLLLIGGGSAEVNLKDLHRAVVGSANFNFLHTFGIIHHSRSGHSTSKHFPYLQTKIT